MFGYLRPYKPELKIKDYAYYNAVYCGFCRNLGKRYGALSRMILSYDATLMCIIDMALKDGCFGFKKKLCPVKPFKKCNFADTVSSMDYWADISVILTYYKIKDNLRDDKNKLKNLILLLFVSSGFKKAAKLNPFAAQCAKEYIEKQTEAENEGCRSLDKAADPTAVLMSKLISHGASNETQRRILERMGIFIGRWIYFADAADDFEKDIKNRSYNPFVLNAPQSGRRDWLKKTAEPLFNSCICEITAALELLELKNSKELIGNVFYLGFPEVKKAVLSGLSIKERKKQFSAVYSI